MPDTASAPTDTAQRPQVSNPVRPRNVLQTPLGFRDNTRPIVDFRPASLEAAAQVALRNRDAPLCLFAATRVRSVETRQRKDTDSSFSIVEVLDHNGHVLTMLAPGEVRPLERYMRTAQADGRPIYLHARAFRTSGKRLTWINPEPVSSIWVGRIQPEYEIHHRTVDAQLRAVEDLAPGSYLAVTRAQSIIRQRMRYHLDDVCSAAAKLILTDGLKCQQAIAAAIGHEAVKNPHRSLSNIFRRAHAPTSLADGEDALKTLNHVAAVCQLADPVRDAVAARRRAARRKIKPPRLTDAQRAMGIAACARTTSERILPFSLTEDQLNAVTEILTDMDSGVPMRRLLSGDVGTGKTPTFSTVVQVALDAGMRVAVISPTEQLARQTFEKLSDWIQGHQVAFCAAGARPDPEARCFSATVGLTGHMPGMFDLVIIDEQQRFARRQRDDLLAERGHQLEVTATCIPRSQALAASGVLSVSKLTTTHVKKNIITRIWTAEDKPALFSAIRYSVSRGDQVLIVHPAKHASQPQKKEPPPETNDNEQAIADGELLAEDTVERKKSKTKTNQNRFHHRLMSVGDVADSWKEAFPGYVRVCHGGLSSEENDAAIDAMRSGEARVLVTTSLVEVGLDIPGIRRVVIMQADRFGVSATHQLRGRAARAGGEGFCDLYIPDEISPRSMERLQTLVENNDGWDLAMNDMALRGGGDLSTHGHRQSGDLRTHPFPDIELSPQDIERASTALLDCYVGDNAHRYVFEPVSQKVVTKKVQPKPRSKKKPAARKRKS